MHNCYEYGSQEVTQSAKITSNKVKVNSSNPPLPLMWTYKKKKNCYEYEQLLGNKFGVRNGQDDVTCAWNVSKNIIVLCDQQRCHIYCV
jgi:hypothetical protein